MKSFLEQLEDDYNSYYWDFVRFLGDGTVGIISKKESTSDRYFSSLIEQWLEGKGFTFRIEFEPTINKVRYVVYYKGDYFDMGEDELRSLEGLKNTHIMCVKHIA